MSFITSYGQFGVQGFEIILVENQAFNLISMGIIKNEGFAMTMNETIENLLSNTTFAADELNIEQTIQDSGDWANSPSKEDVLRFLINTVTTSKHGSIILDPKELDLKFTHYSSEFSATEYLTVYRVIPGLSLQGLAKIDEKPNPRHFDTLCRIALRNNCLFTKFRVSLSPNCSIKTIQDYAETLTTFCSVSLNYSLVPLAEIQLERDTNGGIHSIAQSESQMRQMFNILISKLKSKGVNLKQVILCTNLIEPGSSSQRSCKDSDVTETSAKFFLDATEIFAGVKLTSEGHPNSLISRRCSEIVNKILFTKNMDAMQRFPYFSTSFSNAAIEGVLEAWHNESASAAATRFIDNSIANQKAFLGQNPDM